MIAKVFFCNGKVWQMLKCIAKFDFRIERSLWCSLTRLSAVGSLMMAIGLGLA